MELVSLFIDIMLHLDDYLVQLIQDIQDYGAWIYVILFLVIFAERTTRSAAASASAWCAAAG